MTPAHTTTIPQKPVWLHAGLLLFVSWLAIATLSLQVRSGTEIVAVMFPPWWTPQQVFSAAAFADASIVRLTAIPGTLVVRPDDHEGLTRLRRAGAWLAVDPRAISACLNYFNQENRT